jgi:prepilin-type N-terminal cleavage/methylation domain-containing protein
MQNKGFTLLEILLVIAAIGILASIVIVAINPNRQLAQARNAERRSEITSILNAVYQYSIDSNGSFPAGLTNDTKLEVLDGALATNYATNCTGNATVATGTADGVRLDNVLVATYLAAIPSDPQQPSAAVAAHCMGYAILKNSTTNRITVYADKAELSQTINVTN